MFSINTFLQLQSITMIVETNHMIHALVYKNMYVQHQKKKELMDLNLLKSAAASCNLKVELLFGSLFAKCELSNWMDSFWFCVLQLICISIAIKPLKSTVDSCGTCFCKDCHVSRMSALVLVLILLELFCPSQSHAYCPASHKIRYHSTKSKNAQFCNTFFVFAC